MTDRTTPRPASRRRTAPAVAGQRRRPAREVPAREASPREVPTREHTARAAAEVVEQPTSERTDATTRPVTRPVTGPATRSRLSRLNTMLVPLALAAVIAAGFAWRADTARATTARHTAGAVAAARSNALTAARLAAVDVLSYDYRHFDADVAKGAARLTGDQRAQYQKLMTTTVRQTALDVHAVVKASVSDAAVITATPSSAEVLAFVDQTSSNTKRRVPQLNQDRVVLHLALVDGHWLVTKFDAV